jgi:hypothetical protein
MKVRVAKSEASVLLLDLQALDDFGREPTDADGMEEPVNVVETNDTLGDWAVFVFVIVLTLITLPFQLPFLVLENVREYKRCKRHDLLFVPIRPVVPVPAYRVDTIGALKIFVYPDDHPPPHFHVVTDKYNAKFTIASCDFLSANGEYVTRHERAIKSWYARNADVVAAAWTRTRPTPRAQ